MDEIVKEYINQCEWDKALDRLIERLSPLGEQFSPEKSKEIAGKLFNLAQNYEDWKVNIPKNKSTLEINIDGIIKQIPEGVLFCARDIQSRLYEKASHSTVFYCMQNMSKKEGFLRVWLDFSYFLKPSIQGKDVSIPSKPILPDSTLLEENWNWMLMRIKNSGYCESPEFLKYFGTNSRCTISVLHQCCKKFRELEGIQGNKYWGRIENYKSKLDKWIIHGQSVFDAVVNQLRLPTASLGSKIAIVYHPAEIQKSHNS